MWHIYILESNDGRMYTGITSDIERRFKEHQQGKGARFTKAFGAKKMLYYEDCETKNEALKREAEIKKLTKSQKLSLIKYKKIKI